MYDTLHDEVLRTAIVSLVSDKNYNVELEVLLRAFWLLLGEELTVAARAPSGQAEPAKPKATRRQRLRVVGSPDQPA